MAKYITGALLVAVTACTTDSNDTIFVENLPSPEPIEGERIDLENAEFLTAGMFFAGDYLVCLNHKSPYAFTVYDSCFGLIDQIVRIGGGPDEVISAYYFGQEIAGGKNPEILIFDDQRNRVSTMRINPFEGLNKVFDIPTSEYLSPSSIYYINDTLYAGVNLDLGKSSEIFTFNPTNNKVRRIPNQFNFDPTYGFYTSQSGLAVNTDSHGGYAYYYRNIPWVLIYDNDFNLKRKIAIKEMVDPEVLKEGNCGFVQMYYSGDRIVGLLRELEGTTSRFLIVAMDADGKNITTYDSGKTIGIFYSADRKNLFTIHYDYEEDNIYLKKCTIPAALKL